MAQAIVIHKTTVVPRHNMRKLTVSELNNEYLKSTRAKIDAQFKAIFGNLILFFAKTKCS